jgi:hypothetical protein
MKQTFPKLLIALCLTLGASSALLADVVGTFDINGSTAGSSTATLSNGAVDLNCTLPSTLIPGSCPAGTGNALVDTATGDMAPFFLEGVFVESVTFPLDTPINVPDWLTVTPSILNGTLPAITFDLTFLPLGVFSSADCSAVAAAGQTCTPVGSDLNLENTQTGFTASFDVMGITHFLDGSMGAFTGTFTSTVNGENYQQALATILSGGTVTETYTASFTLSTIPEPSYLAGFAGLGLAVSAIAFYRKRRLRITTSSRA